MAIIGVLVVSLLLGAIVTLLVLTIAAAHRKIRRAQRNSERNQ